MTIAIRKRNQALALESGRMAVVELEEANTRPRPAVAPVAAEPVKPEAPKPEPVKAAAPVKAVVRRAKPAPKKPAVKAASRHRKPAQREHRSAVGKRKAARAVAAGK
jgi:hypothetical protein